MKLEDINVESVNTIEDLVSSYRYALIYEFSRVLLGDATQVNVNFDELNEAYLFNKSEQIHIFKVDGVLKGVKATEEISDEHFFDKKYKLDSKFKALGKIIVVREYLEYDEDGQAIVSYTRLLDVE